MTSVPILLKCLRATTPETLHVEASNVVVKNTLAGEGCNVAGSTQPDMILLIMVVFSIVYITLVRAGTLRTLKCAFLLFLSTSLAAGPAVANVHTGLYLGIGGGTSHLMPGIQNATLDFRDSSDSSWTATAGYQLNRNFGVELEYSNLGTTTLSPLGSIDYQDINLSGIYHWNGEAIQGNGKKFSLYGRLGVGQIRNQSDIELEGANGSHWLAGAGIQTPLSKNLSLRAEGVVYDIDVSRLGLALTYQFGKPSLPAMPSLPYVGPVVDGINGFISDWRKARQAKYQASTSTQTALNDREGRSPSIYPPPYFASADQHEPYRVPYKTVDQMLQIKPAPKKRWLLSQGTRQRRASASAQQMDTAQNEHLTKQESSTKSSTDSSTKSASVSDRSLLKDPRMEASPVLATALPAAASDPGANSAPTIQPLLFSFDKSRLTAAIQNQLQPLIEHLRTTPDARVTLTGHTDSVGAEQYNQMLSLRRAEAVRKFLLQQGIDRKMIRVLGAGEKRPLKSNAKPSGRRANRRVSIVVD